MAREFKNRPKEDIEAIVLESFERIGMGDIPVDKAALLLRLLISGISNYFFEKPDNIVDVGFLRFQKSPDKDELFTVNIMRNGEEGIVNAGTLWKYYKGELVAEGQLKGLIDTFVNDLLTYSQVQEKKIDKLTEKIK